jgi:hypothetical protein
VEPQPSVTREQVMRLHDNAVNALAILRDGRAVTGGADESYVLCICPMDSQTAPAHIYVHGMHGEAQWLGE